MNDVDIKLIGDKELIEALRELDFKTQHRFLKGLLTDSANKTIVKNLRQASPVRTGNLRRSMGVIQGKSKKTATVFAGPRMSSRRDKSEYSGWVANILENAKPGRRYPKNGVAMKIGDNFVKSVGPITKKTNFKATINNSLKQAEDHLMKSVRTVIERAWNRKVKK
jgi:hypothetical protein